jgi:surface polysaccharide O-acyltransferase-like enzyme
MSKLKKALIIALFFSIGLICVFVMCSRAEQINNQPTNEYSYYEYEMSNK